MTRGSNWALHRDEPVPAHTGSRSPCPPGSASAGADYRTNPVTQIRWGLGYIKQVYGSPCGAWAHSQSTGWY